MRYKTKSDLVRLYAQMIELLADVAVEVAGLVHVFGAGAIAAAAAGDAAAEERDRIAGLNRKRGFE